MWWQVTAAMNSVIALCYLGISTTIWRGLRRTGQVRTNPLGLATAAIFLTCAVHHGSHSVHMLLPYLGLEKHEGLAMRTAMGWHMGLLDTVGAVVAVWYLSLRGRYGALLTGPTLFADVKERQRQAVEINDDIVQGLSTALYAMELGDVATAKAASERALAASRSIINDLVGGEHSMVRLDAGDLRRDVAAVPVAAVPVAAVPVAAVPVGAVDTVEPVPGPREPGT
ncbi:MAG: hypothetical protein QOJ92_72 [Frankiales bacterium]|nr:hypothetical protein [Frankiales bacterium]